MATALPSGAGGAAVNSGVDYQQRVSAWFLTQLIVGIDVRPTPHPPGSRTITAVAFETADSVDDLRIHYSDGHQAYLQAKRSLALSVLAKSDFYSATRQLVAQHLRDPGGNISLALVTSSESSASITSLLRELLERARQDPTGLAVPTLSVAQRDVLSKMRGLVNAHYREFTSKGASDQEFQAFLARTYVCVLDLENSQAHESIAIVLLTMKSKVSAELLWGHLVTSSLQFAATRTSVSRAYILDLVGRFLNLSPEQQRTDVIRSSIKVQYKDHTRVPVAGEVVVSHHPDSPAKLILFGLHRFDEKGAFRLKFSKDHVVFLDGHHWAVLYRSATWSRVEKWLQQHAEELGPKELVFAPANGEFDEDSPAAKAQAELCTKMLSERQDLMKCLHCGRAIFAPIAPLVELSDADVPPAAGLVHESCRRPLDRVLGDARIPEITEHEYLINFDVGLWVEARLRGQACFNEFLDARYRGISVRVLWNPGNEGLPDFNYCVEIEMKDGTRRAITSRTKVHRLRKAEAAAGATAVQTALEEARRRGDPMCYTSIKWTFGPYSRLLGAKDEDESLLECVSAQAVKYTEHIGARDSKDLMYYAPLLYLVERESEHEVSIGSVVPLISDPMRLPKFLENWKAAGYVIPEYEVRIAATDLEVDRMLSSLFFSGRSVVVDPLVDLKGGVASGLTIEPFEAVAAAAAAHRKAPPPSE